MRAAARLAAWAGALFGLWLLLVGTNAGLEEVAGAAAAVLAATLRETIVRARTRRIDPSGGSAAQLAALPWVVVRDFALVLRALVRPRRPAWRAVEDAGRGTTPAAAGRRALAELVGSVGPNTYVVDVDPETGRALVHDLDRRRAWKARP